MVIEKVRLKADAFQLQIHLCLTLNNWHIICTCKFLKNHDYSSSINIDDPKLMDINGVDHR